MTVVKMDVKALTISNILFCTDYDSKQHQQDNGVSATQTINKVIIVVKSKLSNFSYSVQKASHHTLERKEIQSIIQIMMGEGLTSKEQIMETK